MSVPEPNRGHGELDVNTKARELTVYTLKILENEKWFPKTQEAYIEKLRDCVIEIQALCWEANNIKVDGKADRYQRRMELQETAAEKCNRLHMLIETAKPLFHLQSKRVRMSTRKCGYVLCHMDQPSEQGKQLEAYPADDEILQRPMEGDEAG